MPEWNSGPSLPTPRLVVKGAITVREDASARLRSARMSKTPRLQVKISCVTPNSLVTLRESFLRWCHRARRAPPPPFPGRGSRHWDCIERPRAVEGQRAARRARRAPAAARRSPRGCEFGPFLRESFVMDGATLRRSARLGRGARPAGDLPSGGSEGAGGAGPPGGGARATPRAPTTERQSAAAATRPVEQAHQARRPPRPCAARTDGHPLQDARGGCHGTVASGPFSFFSL